MDIERLKRDLLDARTVLRTGRGVLGLDGLARTIDELGPKYRIHAKNLRLLKAPAQLDAEITMTLDKIEWDPDSGR